MRLINMSLKISHGQLPEKNESNPLASDTVSKWVYI